MVKLEKGRIMHVLKIEHIISIQAMTYTYSNMASCKLKYLKAYESAYMEQFWTLIDMKNFVEYRTWSMISEVGDIGPVKPEFSDNESFLSSLC